GVPHATETSVDDALSVQLEAASDVPAWYRFAGWSIDLSPDVAWRLVLNGQIDADLTALTITSAAIAGSGRIRLGSPPADGSSVIVAGDLDVVVPPDAAVVVNGEANVPPGWEEAGDRVTSPEGADGGVWSISVQGE